MNPKMFTQIFKNVPFLLLNSFLVGGFNPSEKDSSIGSIIANIYGKLKHVPNHQLDNYMDSKWLFGNYFVTIIIITVESYNQITIVNR